MSTACERVRGDLSALLDDELPHLTASAVAAHLEECAACRAAHDRLSSVRSSLRVGEAEPVPDLSAEVMARLGAGAGKRRRLQPPARPLGARRFPLRTFGVAAAVSALVVGGASLPWRTAPGETASAGEIVAAVRRAARDVSAYHAVFRITELGWHPEVPRRDLRAEVWFAAPERFRLEIDDLTPYPAAAPWPDNDVTLVASPRRLQLREPAHCPVVALPACAGGAPGARTLVARPPFDGRVALPTDIVLPLDTLAGAGAFAVEARTNFAGHDAYRLRLDVRRALPLLSSLQQGGSWRALHPLDEVTVWIEAATWFPLGFDVRAAASPDRGRWAAANGYRDEAGDLLLRVRSRAFDEPSHLPAALFAAPAGGDVTNARFRAGPVPRSWPRPRFLAGLTPYRAGRSGRAAILSYASGTTWLRVTVQPGATASAQVMTAEEIDLGDGRFAYYRPAGPELRRRLDLFGRRFALRLEGNLPRAEMLRVARSTPLDARRLPPTTRVAGGVTLRRLDPSRALAAAPFARLPARLPPGYDPARPHAALLVTTREAETLVLHYRAPEAEYDGIGLRIAQSPARLLPPTSGAPTAVALGEGGRYFAERGELEWLADGVYHSVRAPSFDLGTLVAVARSMR